MPAAPEDTKRHFAELCECIWNKILSKQRLDKKTAVGMRQFVANFAMVAWNMSLSSSSLKETQQELFALATRMYDGEPCAVDTLNDAAELKWHEYREDRNFIAMAEVVHSNGVPNVVVTLKGENPEIDSKFEKFKAALPQAEIEARLAGLPPEQLQDELYRMISEYTAQYNASLESLPLKKSGKRKKAETEYVFRVQLDWDENIYRDIAILGTQTFEDLHDAIFDAFDRFDPHLYSFYIGDYEICSPDAETDDDELNAADVKINKFDFSTGDSFGYLFDYGDEWRHEIEFVQKQASNPNVDYPMVVNRHGDSPEQYGEAEPDEVIHPDLIAIVKAKSPDWDGNPDTLFIDECDHIPSDEEVKSYKRGEFIVSLLQNKQDIPISFLSLKTLFRKGGLDEDASLFMLLPMIGNVVVGLSEDGVIGTISNEEFLQIFSAMTHDPDAPSQSLLHDVLWNAVAIFLLQYECDLPTFKKVLRNVCKSLKQNKDVTFYDFCRQNIDEGDELDENS